MIFIVHFGNCSYHLFTELLIIQNILLIRTVCPTRYRTWLAGGPLLRIATIRRTTDTHYRHIPFHFSHNERTPVQILCNIFIGVRIIKEMPGSVASGTPYIINPTNALMLTFFFVEKRKKI